MAQSLILNQKKWFWGLQYLGEYKKAINSHYYQFCIFVQSYQKCLKALINN